MKDQFKTKQVLIHELASLKQRIQQLEQSELERKRVEEALRESEKNFSVAFHRGPQMMAISDLETGRYMEVNDNFCRVTGFSRDETIGKTSIELGILTQEDRREMALEMQSTGSLSNKQTKIFNKNREPIECLFFGEIIPVSGVNRLLSLAEDISDRKRAEEILRTSRSQLRALSRRLQKVRDEERVMVAREIHDKMGGGLAGLKMDLSWLLRKIGNADHCEARVALTDRIKASNALIDRMIQMVRRISTDLQPSILDDLGLVAALEWQLSEFTSRTEIKHEFTTAIEYINMDKDTAVAVFRIFQEALTNVVRHSQATKVAVFLLESGGSRFRDKTFILKIRDNGRGITEEEIMNPESLGLLGMKERVLAFGGELSISGKPGGGTILVLQIPQKQGEVS